MQLNFLKGAKVSCTAIAIIAIFFSVFLMGDLVWEFRQIHTHAEEKALTEARSLFDLNLAYRRWCAGHGGVYVRVTEKTQPNPYLFHPKRDLTSTDGTELTLVNPAMMTRSVHEILSANSALPIINKVTSLKYLNPANAPDEWEATALHSFDQGNSEASEIVPINGQPYMRMLRPYVAEKGCLVCHAAQGYKLGDVRGGLSVGVPMQPYRQREAIEKKNALLSHVLTWVIGLAGIMLLGKRIMNAEHEIIKDKEKIKAAAIEWMLTFDAINDSILILDGDYRIMQCNQATATLLGKPAEQILGRHCWEFMHESQRREGCPVTQLQLTGKRQSALLQTAGRTYQVTADPIFDEAGAIQKVVHTISDITEQRRLEAELQQAQKMESIGTLAGGIAHDFNNILSAIVGYTDLALMQTKENGAVQENLHQVHKATGRATDLVKQILTFSRKQRQEKSPLQLSLLIKEALKLLRASIPSTIEIRQEITAQGTALADPTQIHQVIMNLCTNAYHAMMERGGVLGVTLKEITIERAVIDCGTELSPGQYLKLSVSDTGCGIDQETMARIFEPYFTTKVKGRGTGLGLATVHGIVKDHQGRIAVYSEPGRGTTFNVYLPMIAAEHAVAPQVAVLPPMSKANERIMVVDDEEAIRDMTCQFLTQAGYRVDLFTTGVEAWAALNQTPDAWHLLLTDQTMPGMTGDQLAAKVRELRPDLPVIISSGFSEILDDNRVRDLGVKAYLQKPVGVFPLLSAVAKALYGEAA